MKIKMIWDNYSLVTEKIDLSGSNLNNLGKMPSFPLLKKLKLSDNNLKNLDGISVPLSNLKLFHLENNRLSSLTCIPQDLQSLEMLFLKNNKLKNLPIAREFTKKIPNLDYLDLSYNEFTDFKDIHWQFPELKVFNIKHNHLNSLESFAKLGSTKIEFLHIQENKIESLRSRSGSDPNKLFKKLIYFNLNKNQIKSLKGLPNKLPNLEIFDLSNNPLENLDFFPQILPKIKKIDLHGIKLKNLDGFLKNSPKLEKLIISEELIEDFGSLPANIKVKIEFYKAGKS